MVDWDDGNDENRCVQHDHIVKRTIMDEEDEYIQQPSAAADNPTNKFECDNYSEAAQAAAKTSTKGGGGGGGGEGASKNKRCKVVADDDDISGLMFVSSETALPVDRKKPIPTLRPAPKPTKAPAPPTPSGMTAAERLAAGRLAQQLGSSRSIRLKKLSSGEVKEFDSNKVRLWLRISAAARTRPHTPAHARTRPHTPTAVQQHRRRPAPSTRPHGHSPSHGRGIAICLHPPLTRPRCLCLAHPTNQTRSRKQLAIRFLKVGDYEYYQQWKKGANGAELKGWVNLDWETLSTTPQGGRSKTVALRKDNGEVVYIPSLKNALALMGLSSNDWSVCPSRST